MTTAHYMRQVLTNPLSGFYMHSDVFGTQGDFITSPEISQMFGEVNTDWKCGTTGMSINQKKYLVGRYMVLDRMDAIRQTIQNAVY